MTSSRSAAPTSRTPSPLTVGQEWSGYATQLEHGLDRLEHATAGLYELAMGGTAVGTGLERPTRVRRRRSPGDRSS